MKRGIHSAITKLLALGIAFAMLFSAVPVYAVSDELFMNEEAAEETTGETAEITADDEVEQAYRQGYHDGFKCCNDKMVSKLMNENAELRDTVKVQSEQILWLRECINRNHEDFYE